MKLHFKNSNSLKFEITKIDQTPHDYWNSINNIKGDLLKNKGEDFNIIVLKSLNYFFLNCLNPSLLSDSDWNLSFAKSLLDKNNTTGFSPILIGKDSKNIEVYEAEFYKECFSFIQLAYYINEIAPELQNNQFFTYLKHYLKTGIKLPEDQYFLDKDYLNKKYIDYTKTKTNPDNLIYKWFYGCLFLLLNDLGLSTSNFTISIKDGREYNPIVKVPREFRKFFPFVLLEYDITSAFPHFIDTIIDTNIAPSLYDNISKEFNLTRSEAKTKFSKIVNSGKYYKRHYFASFLNPIYKDKTDKLIDLILDKNYPFWNRMQVWESIAVDTFKKSNKIENVTRLHDAIIIIENTFLNEIRTDFIFYEFELKRLNKMSETLNFRVNQSKPKFSYVSAIPSKIKHQIRTENDSKNGIKFISRDFDIYKEPFNYIKGSFNISFKGQMTKEGFKFITESEFINKVINCGLVLRDLNPEINSKGLESIILEIINNIHVNGVYSFNKELLFNIVMDSISQSDLTPIVKTKNWNFKGNSDFNNLNFYEFSKLLNEARLKGRLFFLSKKILPIIESSYKNKTKIYIDLKSIGINDKRDCEVLSGMIESFNIANGFDSFRFAKTLNEFIKKAELCTKFGTIYKDSLYKVPKLVHNLSETALSKEFGINRRTAKKIKDWFGHNQNKSIIEDIYFTLQAIANNQKDLNFEIVKDNRNHLTIKKVDEVKEKTELITIDPKEAFFTRVTKTNITPKANNEFTINIKGSWDKTPDFKNSVLNMDLDRAIETNNEFITSWFLYQLRDQIPEGDRILLKNDYNRTADFVKDIFYNDKPLEWNPRGFYNSRKLAS